MDLPQQFRSTTGLGLSNQGAVAGEVPGERRQLEGEEAAEPRQYLDGMGRVAMFLPMVNLGFRRTMGGLSRSADSHGETDAAIVKMVTDFYVTSHDFNGIAFSALAQRIRLEENEMRPILVNLVRNGTLTLCFSSVSINPHIKRLPDLPISTQLELLQEGDASGICVYPSPAELSERIDPRQNADEPYTRALFLGEAQLSPRFFDLPVMERYRIDPRYRFQFRHLNGRICILSPFYEAEDFPERDKILIENLGLAVTKEFHRKIVVFLRYLYRLSPSHQQYWKGYETPEECIIVPEYYYSAFSGDWPTHMSIYDAILKEIEIINDICRQKDRPPLFRNTFKNEPPEGFGILMHLTSKSFEDFTHILDKMLSENISIEFFMDEVPLADTKTRDDGTVERLQRGSIRVLEEWLNIRWRGVDEGTVSGIVNPMKEVRRIRQKPAHKIQHNRYDVAYEDKQRELVAKIYISLRDLRLLLSNYLDVHDVKVPSWLKDGRIKNY